MQSNHQPSDEKVIFLHGLSQYNDDSMTLDLVEIDLDADLELDDETLPRMQVHFDKEDNCIEFFDTGINTFMQFAPVHFSEMSVISHPENHVFVLITNFMSLIFMYGDDNAYNIIKNFTQKNNIKLVEGLDLFKE